MPATASTAPAVDSLIARSVHIPEPGRREHASGIMVFCMAAYRVAARARSSVPAVVPTYISLVIRLLA
jgi:hypothetical protein